MAAGGNIPELGGYDFEFTSKVPEYWECLVCHLTMKDPVQIVGCGHRLCNICMESLLRRPSPTCPADRKPLSREKIFPDAACHRQILDLTVKCSHSGCLWTGELRAVEKHQSQCPFKVVNCPNSGCTETFTKQDLHKHVTFKCSWREVHCYFCQNSIILSQKKEHFGVCRKFPVQCTNKCGLRDIPREKLDVHVQDECPLTIVQCEYKNLGCGAVFARSNAKSHLEAEVERHLNLALRGLEATQLQVNKLDNLVMEQSVQIEQLMSKNTKQAQQIERLVSKDKEQSQQIERLNYSPFFLQIPDFKAVYDRAVTGEQVIISSEPFYLSRYGCRFIIKIMPDGGVLKPDTGVGGSSFKGQYLSLFIVVVPGEFDGFLPWPTVSEEVRVTLIDQDPQQHLRRNISKVFDFRKDPWSCPKDENSIVLGSCAFVEQKILGTRSYLNNNTMRIMVSKNNA